MFLPYQRGSLLLSSLHWEPTLGNSGRPEIDNFYNLTKGEVGVFDQKCGIYSCGRAASQWPICMFYGMINTILINSWVIHSENTEASGGKPLIRRKYMQLVAKSPIMPWAQQRLDTPWLSFSMRKLIRDICNVVRHRSQGGHGREPRSSHILYEVPIKEAQEDTLPLHQVWLVCMSVVAMLCVWIVRCSR